MDGDSLPNGTQRSVAVLTTAGWIVDAQWRRGLLVESRLIDVTTGSYVDYDYFAYNGVATAVAGAFSAVRADQTSVFHGTRQGAGWRDTETRTTYNAEGFAYTVWERGDLANGFDDTCSYTSFATSTLRLRGLPLGSQLFAGSTCAGPLAAYIQFAYDGDTTGSATPTKGNLTRQRVFTTPGTYLETKYSYDLLGARHEHDRPERCHDHNGL